MCCLYVLEPLALGFFTEEIETSDGIWRTARLALLWLGITYCAHLLVDASLLAWLKKFCDSKGFTIDPLNSRDESSGSSMIDDL